MRPEQRTGDEEITTRKNSSSTTAITAADDDDDAAAVVVAVVGTGTAGGRERSFHSQETEKASGSCNRKKIDVVVNRDDDNDVDDKMLRTHRIVESRLWEEDEEKEKEEKVEVVVDGVVAVATAADRIRLLVERDLSAKNEPKVILGALYRLSQMCASCSKRRSRKSSSSSSSNDVIVDDDDDDVVVVVEGCEGGQRQARINRFILYQSRAYVFVIRAMEKYAHHALVQAWGCHVLGLCSGDSSSTGSGSIDDPSTTAAATTATTAIVGMGGVQAILHAMTKFPNDQPLQFQACKALNKVTANNKEGLTLFVKLDGIRAVVSTMKRFPSSEYIQARSGSLLCSCCCCRTNNSEFHLKHLKEAKAASAILEACENHPNSQAIRKWARPIFKTLLNL